MYRSDFIRYVVPDLMIFDVVPPKSGRGALARKSYFCNIIFAKVMILLPKIRLAIKKTPLELDIIDSSPRIRPWTHFGRIGYRFHT